MGKNLNLHPLTVMFSLLAGGFLGGILGMLMALPIAACLKVVFNIYYTPFIEKVEELVRSSQSKHPTLEPECPPPPLD
jgi:predicted PurR-regulated permease PerM